MAAEMDTTPRVEVRLGAEGGEAEVRQYDAASGTWSEWIEEGDLRRRIKGYPHYAEWSKEIREKVKVERERRAKAEGPAPSIVAEPREAQAARSERLRKLLRDWPDMTLARLGVMTSPEIQMLYPLAKRMHERGELITLPNGALSFRDQQLGGEDVQRRVISVRVLEDLPEIRDSCGKDRLLKKGELVQLPDSTARALIRKGKAEEVLDIKEELTDLPTKKPEASPSIKEAIGVPALQREYMANLQAVQDAQTRKPRPILIQHFKQDTWHPWSECEHVQRVFTNSTLLNEILADFDTEDWVVIREEGGKLVQYLNAEGIPYLLAWSGGKGIHVHIFADLRRVELDPAVSENLEERIDYGVDVPSTIRRVLFDHLMREAGVDCARAKLDPLKVDFSTHRKGSMIRSFGCLRSSGEKYAGGVKTQIDVIPEQRPTPGTLPLRFPGEVRLWDVCPLSSLINAALREAIKSAGSEAFVPQAIEGPLASVPCYNGLRTNGAPDGMRNKGAFAIALFNRVHGRPIEEARAEMRTFSAACPHSSPELVREHQGVLEGVYGRQYHGVSCKMMRQDFGEGTCDKTACPLCTKKPKPKDQAERLIELAEQGGRSEFFQDERGEPHVRAWVKDHYEIMEVRKSRFRLWLSREMYRIEGKAPRGEAVKAALDELSARGLFSGKRYPLSLRVAEHDGAFWLDLCDDRWRAIRISVDGWQIVDEPPILFRRYKHMLPLDEPKAGDGTALNQLVMLANLGKVDREHLKVQLVTDLIAGIVQPGQYVSGGHGSGKTWIGRIEKMTIDPAVNVSNSMPKKTESLELLLDHNYIVCIGNLTFISDEVSDMLSCAITGDARRSRMLYTDDDEAFKLYRRIVRLDGIANAIRLSDLMDRLIYRYPPRIEKGGFIDDKYMEARILELRPYVLHELLDLLAKAMRSHLTLERPKWAPRMSGWYRWALAAAEALAMGTAKFEETFKPYIERQDSEALDGDMLAVALAHISETGFLGTSTDLWNRLEDPKLIDSCKIDTRDPSWPRSAKKMSKRLSMIGSNLEAMGAFLQRDLTYSEAHTRFGPAINSIPRGREEEYVKQDRMIILTSEKLSIVEQPSLDRSTQECPRSTDDERTEEDIC